MKQVVVIGGGAAGMLADLFGGVADVRAGRFIELDVADGTSDADLDAMCAKLLANTVIENYRIERP